MKVKKNYKLYLLLFLLIFSHQYYFIITPSNHGCGSDLPLNFLYQTGEFDNSFSGESYPQNKENYIGNYIKIDCDIGGVIIHTGSPKKYLLLEGSNSIERPLHHISAMPLVYFSNLILRTFNVPIENSIINVYLSNNTVNQQQFYLSWYYAHVLQNLLLVFLSFYIFNLLVKPNYLTTFIFYFLFYLPVLGQEILSPDMSLWIPISILLNFLIINNFQIQTERIKIILILSVTILLYPIFIINYLFTGLLYLNSIFKKNINFSQAIKEGLIVITPYLSYRFLLYSLKINFQPATWAYIDKNVECQSYCQGVWMFIEANTKNGILNELFNRINDAISDGHFISFFVILLCFLVFKIFNERKDEQITENREFYLLLLSIIIFLILVGNFLDRYINYLPTVLFVNELKKLRN